MAITALADETHFARTLATSLVPSPEHRDLVVGQSCGDASCVSPRKKVRPARGTIHLRQHRAQRPPTRAHKRRHRPHWDESPIYARNPPL